MVEGVRPPPLLLWDAFRLVEPRVSCRARTVTTAVMPGAEGGCRRTPSTEPGSWIDEIGVVAVVAAEVLAPQAETRLAGQDAGAVAEAGWVERLALVVGRVEDRARNL